MAQSIFLNLAGIPGDSVDARHQGDLDVESFSWGESMPVTGAVGSGGAVSGRVSMQDVTITARTNRATPLLMLACAQGKHLATARLSVAHPNTGDFLHWTFSDVLILSFETGGARAGDTPTDQFTLNFSKMQYEFFPQRPDGSLDSPVSMSWDVVANKSG